MPPALLASSSHRLAGKRALVTGGTRGIGRAIAERFAAEGAAVAITYSRSRHEAEALAARITEAGGVGFAIEARFEETGSIDALFATLDQRFRDQFGDTALDIVVNSAGIAAPAPIATISEEDYERIFAINTKGAMFVARAAAARMREGGRIINIGSGAAKQPGGRNGVYGMSKAALLALTRSLAVDLGARGITVNCVSPGFTRTDMTAPMLADEKFVERLVGITALRRIGEPEDIAAVVAFLASQDGRWVTGQWIEATGGYKLVPPV